MLLQCWASVSDSGRALPQHRLCLVFARYKQKTLDYCNLMFFAHTQQTQDINLLSPEEGEFQLKRCVAMAAGPARCLKCDESEL